MLIFYFDPFSRCRCLAGPFRSTSAAWSSSSASGLSGFVGIWSTVTGPTTMKPDPAPASSAVETHGLSLSAEVASATKAGRPWHLSTRFVGRNPPTFVGRSRLRTAKAEAHPPSPRLRRVPTSHSSTGLHPWLSAKEGKSSSLIPSAPKPRSGLFTRTRRTIRNSGKAILRRFLLSPPVQRQM